MGDILHLVRERLNHHLGLAMLAPPDLLQLLHKHNTPLFTVIINKE